MRRSQYSTRTRLRFAVQRGASHHRQREHRAGRNALLTPCADWRVYMQSGTTQLDRIGRTEWNAQPAFIAGIPVDDGNASRDEARHARDVMNTSRLCQANALLAHTRSTTLRPDAPSHASSVPTARL